MGPAFPTVKIENVGPMDAVGTAALVQWEPLVTRKDCVLPNPVRPSVPENNVDPMDAVEVVEPVPRGLAAMGLENVQQEQDAYPIVPVKYVVPMDAVISVENVRLDSCVTTLRNASLTHLHAKTSLNKANVSKMICTLYAVLMVNYSPHIVTRRWVSSVVTTPRLASWTA